MLLSNKSRAKPELSFEAIGTSWEIELFEPVPADQLRLLGAAINVRIDQFDHHYSRFRPDSLVTAMGMRSGTYQLPSDAQPLFDLYLDIYRATNGAVTPLVGQLLSDAGYNATYSLKPGRLHRAPSWEEMLEYDYPLLTLKQPVLLDLGAAGKGYLVDIVADLIESRGISSYCVNAGGDLLYRHAGHEKLEVGLEHPTKPRQVIGVAHLRNQSLCGSASNRRAWGKFHHIIDPLKLTSPRHIRAVWVTAGTTMLADALTAALFFTPAKSLALRYKFEYAIIYQDYSLEHSPGFPADFFTSNQSRPS